MENTKWLAQMHAIVHRFMHGILDIYIYFKYTIARLSLSHSVQKVRYYNIFFTWYKGDAREALQATKLPPLISYEVWKLLEITFKIQRPLISKPLRI